MRNQLVKFAVYTLIFTVLSGFALPDGGIGIKIRQEATGAFIISEIVAEGPADQAGVFAGEEIKGVDGNSVSRLNLEQVVTLIRGEVGTELILTLQHASYPNMRNIKLKRYALPIKASETFKTN